MKKIEPCGAMNAEPEQALAERAVTQIHHHAMARGAPVKAFDARAPR